MSLWIFIKVFGDVLLFHTIAGAYVSLFSFPVSAYTTAVLCAIGAGIACFSSENKKHKLRFIGLIFPAAVVFLVSQPEQLIPLTPVLLYAGIVIIRGNFNLEYYGYRQIFIRTLVLLGIFLLYTAAFDYIYWYFKVGKDPIIDMTVFWRYGLVYVACGVYLQRSLRFGVQTSKYDRRLNNRQFAAVIVGSVALVALAVSFRNIVMYAVWYAMAAVSAVAGGTAIPVVNTIDKILEMDFSKTEEQNAQFIEYVNSLNQNQYATQEQVGSVAEALQKYSGILSVAAVIAICILLVVLFYFFLKTGKEPDVQGAVTKIAVTKTPENKPQKNNRWKVRRHYRDFLKFEREHGFLIRTTHTSADILENVTKETDPKAAQQLRMVYLKARYDERAEITPIDVRMAKDAMSRIKQKV